MKNQVVINKKIIVPSAQKKNFFLHNPYNDLPSSQIPTTISKSPAVKLQRLNKPAQKQKVDKKLQVSKSPVTKNYKVISPDVIRTVGLSTNSNDSLNKMKTVLVDSKKIVTKVKIQKYNDYFDMEGPDKAGKKQINAPKKSIDSINNSVKSAQSQSKKFFLPQKDLNKVVNKTPISKPFPLTTSVTKPNPANLSNDSNKIQTPGLSNILNNIPIAKTNKSGDDRKSWSYSNLNANTKTNDKQIDLNKNPFFANVDLKNNRNTAGHLGNPEVAKKSPGIEVKNDKSGKSVSKRETGKFFPSASKSQNSQSSDKLKKLNDSNKIGNTKIENNQKKMQIFIPTKEQPLITYCKILSVGQNLRLKVLSLQPYPKPACFKVLRILAQDEKTSLYLIEQKYTGFLYCLKKCEVVKPNKQNNQEHVLNAIQYLIRQSKIGAAINHPNIIKTYCTLYDGLHIYQLLQFIEGSNLYDRNKNQFCPTTSSTTERDGLGAQKSSLSTFLNKMYSIKQILYQILEALAYVHQRGIVHRDIKPANILITHDNSYKVGDFGTAIWEFSGQPIGTLDYAAPEVMTKDKYDYSVDIWAVGCIAFELYVGYPPFFNQNRDVTIKKIIDCNYDYMLLQDQGLANLVSKMLQKRPKKRITAKDALLHPFLSEFKHNKEQL